MFIFDTVIYIGTNKYSGGTNRVVLYGVVPPIYESANRLLSLVLTAELCGRVECINKHEREGEHTSGSNSFSHS